ncbi:hypothetical protein [Armatimonas sp.]|uniref:hypothetical protein n=1 Tax=Armatimonas sp. TaxID=1872638 RepID=UPI00286C2CD2|nr:hypothetical protein [Armatimonas sp.]
MKGLLFLPITLLVLLGVGLYLEELRPKHVAFCLALALAVFAVFQMLHWHWFGYAFFLTLLDGILVLVIFKGDIRL